MEDLEADKIYKAKLSKSGQSNLVISSEKKQRKFGANNEAVKSLDIALDRLKKSKLVETGVLGASKDSRSYHESPIHDECTPSEEFITEDGRPTTAPLKELNPVMSMNFSHYELLRNISLCNSNISKSCSATLSPTDLVMKGENLEKYFQSAEIWKSSGYAECGSSSIITERSLDKLG